MGQTLIRQNQIVNDGWIPAGETWTYASATTITVPSGAASKYQKGDKIKLTQTTAKYFYVVSVADTVLTVTGGSDYTVANAAITSPYYSKIENPQGFPHWFAFSGITFSCVTSGTISFSNTFSSFCINGNKVTLEGVYLYSTSSSPVGSLQVTTSSLPVTISGYPTSGQRLPIGEFIFIDIGALNDSLGYIRHQEGAGNMYMPITGINNGYLDSGDIGAGDYITVRMSYRM